MAVPMQHLVDRLSALALLGRVDVDRAREVIDAEDWNGARRLIREAPKGARSV